MLLDGLGWSHYSVFAPCIMTQTRVLGRSGGANSLCKCCSLCLSFWNSVKACNLFWKQCIVNGYILPVFCSFGDLRLADYDPVFKASLPSRDYNRKKVLS